MAGATQAYHAQMKIPKTTYRRKLLRLALYPALQAMAAMPLPALAAPPETPETPETPGIPGVPSAPGAPALSAALRLVLPPAAVQLALLDAVAHLPATHPRRRRYRLALPFGAPLFPPDHLLRGVPGQPADAGIEAWLALPPGQRRHDVLLLPDEDYYWREPGDTAGEYSAQFIVHLAQDRAAGTALSIVQAQARRRRGKSFHLLGRTGPGLYWNIAPAVPSPGAAATLAADLAQWLPAMRQGA
jgi:hypothetical protein